MKYLFLHHTADPSGGLQFQKVNAYHKGKGFPKSLLGFYVGYTYLIERTGEILQGRIEGEERGSHTVADIPECSDNNACGDLNKEGLAICFAGNLSYQLLTDEQKESGESLILEILKRWQLKPSDILNHRDVSETACPGMDLKTLFLKNIEPKYLQAELKKTENAFKYHANNPMRLRSLQRKAQRLRKWIEVL